MRCFGGARLERRTRIARMTRINNNSSLIEPSGRALPERALAGRIVGAFYDTYNELGYGLLESVYSAALEIVLNERGHVVRREPALSVHFHGHVIGSFRADMIVDDRVVLEIKAGRVLAQGALEQLINYLRISQVEVGLLLFFGPRPEFSRRVLSRR